MKKIEVTIKGISPLLQNRFPMAGADDKSKRRTGIPDWKAEGETSLYRDEDGKIYQPASHLESALVHAAGSFKIPGKRGSTYSNLVAATVYIEPDAIEHKIQQYEIDARPVVVQRARVVRYRGRLDKWELTFNIQMMDDQVPVEVLNEILNHAGLYVGIGDFRTQKSKGKFGKFMVTEFKEL
jgi:hypothetical protein